MLSLVANHTGESYEGHKAWYHAVAYGSTQPIYNWLVLVVLVA